MRSTEHAELVAAKPFLTEQDYTKYTAEQQQLWGELVRRRMAQLEHCACREYLQGWRALGLGPERIPYLPEISERLYRRTGWRVQPVSGFMPEGAFFEMLAARQFPSTIWLRSRAQMDYIPEPDLLHDALGHLPMFAEQSFADAVAEYGLVCHAMEDDEKLERMGRLYWYTFEFGLIRQGGEVAAGNAALPAAGAGSGNARLPAAGTGSGNAALPAAGAGSGNAALPAAGAGSGNAALPAAGAWRVYGSGVASSQQECTNVLAGGCEIRDFSVAEVLNTTVKVDQIHKRLFAIKAFAELHTAVGEARKIVEGK